MQWNLAEDKGTWMIKEKSVEQIGCIHTCQGLELDYVGVVIGPDLQMKNGQLITDPKSRSKNDRSIFGWKKQMKTDPEGTLKKLVDKQYVTLHGNMWSLTEVGFETASNLYNQIIKSDE